MTTTLVVLWLYLSSWGPFALEPGWWSAAVLDAEACAAAQARVTSLALCAPPGVTPEPLARLVRR